MTKTLICYMEDDNSEEFALTLKEKSQYATKKLSEISADDAKDYDEIILIVPCVLALYNDVEKLANKLKKFSTQSILLISPEVSNENNIFADRLAKTLQKTIYAATYPNYTDVSVKGEIITRGTPAAVQACIKKDTKHILTLIHDIAAFKKPRNTYEKEKAIPKVSMDTAIALSYLYTMKNHGTQGLAVFIDDIEDNPNMSKVEILSIVENNPVTRKALEDEFEKKYDALGKAYQKLLSRMVKSGGIFQEFWQWVYGASEFTALVRKKFYNDLAA